MIIADTSVWIDFFKLNSPVNEIMEEQLEMGNILALECIFGELLQGVKTTEEKKIIVSYWNNLPKYNPYELFIKAGSYSSENKLVSKGVGLIDAAILICGIETKSKIWTFDKKLLGVLDDKYIYEC